MRKHINVGRQILKNEKFEIIEKLREEMRMSRAGFLQFLADKCIDDNKIL